jgi:Protein of unknown function (DUF4058)
MPIHDWTRVGAGTFHDFHTSWAVEIKRALNAGALPPGYYAQVEQVVGSFTPDVLTLRAGAPDRILPPADPAGGVAVAVSPPRVRFTAQLEGDAYAAKAREVVIRHASGDRIVALIEILSPGNKASRPALRALVEKAAAVLRGDCHLLLIDPFPPGPRDPQGIHAAVWEELGDDGGFALPSGQPLVLAAYAAGPVKRAYVEPIAVGDVLPDMPLFLTPEVYVGVPLERTYLAAWETVPQRWRAVLEPSPGE